MNMPKYHAIAYAHNKKVLFLAIEQRKKDIIG